jgi:hypothetical protein
LKDANGNATPMGGVGGAIRPKISFRRLSGDVLSSATTLAQSVSEKSQIAPVFVHAILPAQTTPPPTTISEIPSNPDLINLKLWFNKTPTKKEKEYCQNMLSLRSMYKNTRTRR